MVFKKIHKHWTKVRNHIQKKLNIKFILIWFLPLIINYKLYIIFFNNVFLTYFTMHGQIIYKLPVDWEVENERSAWRQIVFGNCLALRTTICVVGSQSIVLIYLSTSAPYQAYLVIRRLNCYYFFNSMWSKKSFSYNLNCVFRT